MFDSRQLAALPAFREFYRLIRNLFGVDVAVIAPDGMRGVFPGPGRDLNPFCAAIERDPEGRRRCIECDAVHARIAAARRVPLRYVCHAGLTEFVIPIVVEGAVVAHLQCGQVLDRAPDAAAWRRARARLDWLRRGAEPKFRGLFRLSPVIPKARQQDLIALLHLFAHHATLAHVQRIILERRPQDRILSRAQDFLRDRFRDDIGIAEVAAAAGTSSRTLARLFREREGVSVLARLHRLRVAYASDRLRQTSEKVSTVALDSGFGSIPQFNRIFRAVTGHSPSAWRVSSPFRSASRSRAGRCAGRSGRPRP